MATQAEILAFAAEHSPKAASAHYGVKVGTIWSWRSRAKQRAALHGTDPPPPTPAERWLAEAKQTAERYLRRVCLRCEGSGLVHLAPVRRGTLVIRVARTIPCPDCGAPTRRIQVTEWPRAEWNAAMARAGDAGFGWSASEWRLIRQGEVDPDGRRITGRPDA
jgi:hypothetical protein